MTNNGSSSYERKPRIANDSSTVTTPVGVSPIQTIPFKNLTGIANQANAVTLPAVKFYRDDLKNKLSECVDPD